MNKLAFLFACLTAIVVSVTAQPEDVPIITPENAVNLALFRRILPAEFGVPDATIAYFEFRPHSPHLVIAMDSAFPRRNALIGLYDMEQSAVVALIEDETFRGTGFRTEALYFSADGDLVVTTGQYGEFNLWGIERQEHLFGGSPPGLSIITPDHRHLIILADNIAHIWDIEQKREVERRQFVCTARAVMDGQAVECSEPIEGGLLVKTYALPTFDLVESPREVELPQPYGYVEASSVTPDGRFLVQFRHAIGEDNFYEIIDRETGSVVERVRRDDDWGGRRFVANNSGQLVVYGFRRPIMLHNPRTGEDLLSLIETGEIYFGWSQYQFDPQGKYLIAHPEASIILMYAAIDCYVTTNREINLRSGPGVEFDNPEVMRVSERLAVDGQARQGSHTWWHLGIGLWVREDIVDEHGEGCSMVEMMN